VAFLFRFEDAKVDVKQKIFSALDELEVRPFIYNAVCHSQSEYHCVNFIDIFIFFNGFV
jgi:hypothetical protein